MEYFFIYSAGGGAGDWNGIKRIWESSMPERLKKHILLKFGDIFFNHVSSKALIRPQRWQHINNIRQWLYQNVNDKYTLNNSEILLDSGTAKIVAWIAHHNPDYSSLEILQTFDKIIEEYQILDKYVSIIINSNINYAVSFDIPNPFKIRSQNSNTRTNLINNENDESIEQLTINYCAKYTNKLYRKLSNEKNAKYATDRLMITCNGKWTTKQYKNYLQQLEFEPKNIAIGGLTRNLKDYITNLTEWDIGNYSKIHYLGCGGLQNVACLKRYNLDYINSSVDVSTPLNRAIDGNTSGTTWSGYFAYTDKKLYRIKDSEKEHILNIDKNYPNKLFSQNEMNEILDKILLHQSGNSSTDTYDARAKLVLHNNDVFRDNANSQNIF